MQTIRFISVSDHSPSIGRANELINNPDTRTSHQVEIDERRWHDKALHRRIDSLIVEVGRVSDFIFLIAEKQDQLARDLQAERIARMEADAQVRSIVDKTILAMTDYVESNDAKLLAAIDRITEIESVNATLRQRTWWTMLKDSVRTFLKIKGE